MVHFKLRGTFTLPFFLFLSIIPLHAEVKVPNIIGNNMVLQQDVKVCFWGKADPGEQVTVAFRSQSAQATTDASGKWSLWLGPFAAGGPEDLSIKGKDLLQIKNVLVGEVWICSGQSNMEWPLSRAANSDAEIISADYPNIHLFTVTKKTSLVPLDDVEGHWEICSPKTAGEFSAVGYFFGRELNRKLTRPLGLIHSSWGGTVAEAWTSEEALQAIPALQPIVARLEKVRQTEASSGDKKEEAESPGNYEDPGNKGIELGYAKPKLDLSDWKKMPLPQYWENTGLNIDGAVWFRKSITLPPVWAGKDLTLSLGAIDDFDTTYFNGTLVGGMGPEKSDAYAAPRKYLIPGKLVEAGINLVAVRVFDHFGNGGFGGEAADMNLLPANQKEDSPLSLAGPWDYKVELSLKPKPDLQNLGANNPNTPTVLFNAMIAPLLPYSLRGAIWYQGESNASRAHQYRTLFPAMIQNWHRAWNQPGFPFYFVQLANFMSPTANPGESEWAELREAQLLTSQFPNTGMAVIIDIGEAKDIHPKNKQEVGLRLAKIALSKTYGQELVYSGPSFDSSRIMGNKILIRFNQTGSGLVTRNNEPLKGFAIAGPDQQWVWAQAEFHGNNEVSVWSEQVPQPAAVRYGWANNPECNLYNKEGLPASPFRTDDWQGLTEGKE
jgi:sialate O-acetylesterase